MKYVRATTVLPDHLVEEIQKYVQGEAIYIPKPASKHEGWGMRSGGRKVLDERNERIRVAYQDGQTIRHLAEEYFLSVDSIKKIIYGKK
ncbi:CD3324 family protein [Paenibacillus sp. Marseille-Q4541]|uniref:CD3324 family protein n=1 Tax=Paenibacillus sp. Marseille-Q4541 TaxID=2831522 RepID=UPI001BAC484F|nr:CD3324 family protein [Paenibacillus sp. Marseille-Q4541]